MSNIKIMASKGTRIPDQGGKREAETHHSSGMFPFDQFIQNSQKIDTGKQVAPTEHLVITIFLQKI